MGDDIDRHPVLVTGASGYLGSRISAMLGARGTAVVGTGYTGQLPCDLTDADATRRLVKRVRADTVIHCAARVPKNDAGYDDEAAARANLAMVANLISARPRHIVFTSTMAVYAEGLVLPVRETHEVLAAGAYARSKKAAETMLLAGDVPTATILRLPGLFGAPRRGGLLYSAAVAFASGHVPRTPPKPPLWAAMHVDDAADLCVRGIQRAGSSIVINAAYRGQFSVSWALAKLAALYGAPMPACPPCPIFEVDTALMERELGTLSHDFESRLSELARWVEAEVQSAPAHKRDNA